MLKEILSVGEIILGDGPIDCGEAKRNEFFVMESFGRNFLLLDSGLIVKERIFGLLGSEKVGQLDSYDGKHREQRIRVIEAYQSEANSCSRIYEGFYDCRKAPVIIVSSDNLILQKDYHVGLKTGT